MAAGLVGSPDEGLTGRPGSELDGRPIPDDGQRVYCSLTDKGETPIAENPYWMGETNRRSNMEAMMNRQTRSLLILALLLIAVVAFLTLDFHLSRAELATNSEAARYSFSVDEAQPLPQGVDLDLYVLATGRLDPALAEKLVEALQRSPYVGAVTLREEPLQAAAGSVLVVRVGEPAKCLWTPFYTKTEVEVNVAYASDGDVAWIDSLPVALEASDPPRPVVRVDADLTLAGSGYGLISSPAYTDYLAEALAEQIGDLLQNQLATATT